MGAERRERLYRLEAVVLKRRDFGEADRLLTCFSREEGKLTLLAKGVRKTTSRKAGHLELFMYSRLLVARGRTWDIITQAECAEPFLPVREDLVRTSLAYYAADLIDLLTEERDPNPPLFELLSGTLRRVGEAQDARLPVRYFELHALGLAGFQPELFTCLECGKAIQPAENFFHYARGGVLCPACGAQTAGARRVSLPALKVLRFMQTRPYQAVGHLHLRESVHLEAEDLLYHYITYTLERAPKSVEFVHTLRRTLPRASAPSNTP